MVGFLASVIFSILMAGYASTILYRIPNKISLYGQKKGGGKPPFCSNCHHPLKFYEYYPVIGWLFCRGRCNYCHQPISKLFIINEMLIIVCSIFLYIKFGLTEAYIVNFIFASLSIISCLIIIYHKIFEEKLFYILLVIILVVLSYNQMSLSSIIFRLFSAIFPFMILKQMFKSGHGVKNISYFLFLNFLIFPLFTLSIFTLATLFRNKYFCLVLSILNFVTLNFYFLRLW